MRKNSPRKWLHAILDLLPVLILPIFALAVRSDNNFQPIEVQAQDFEVVDFNQLVSYENSDSIINNGNYFTYEYKSENSIVYVPIGNYSKSFKLVNQHKYYIKIILNGNIPGYLDFYINQPYFRFGTTSQIFQATSNSDTNQLVWFLASNSTDVTFNCYLELFDLTQMFGEGNEPTIQEFDSYYTNSHYSYTLSKKELLNVGTTTYNDSDVGSQMVYTLYNATDKYFNFNNVFNFGHIYDWFLLNIFNGNATLIFPVVWQIVLYEFIMDLVFLIYALFMFFIDFCTNLIDRFYVKCSGGK